MKDCIDELKSEMAIETLQAWMRAYVARVLKADADVIDVNATLDDIGLDSLAIAGLIGDLEKHSGVKLSSNVAMRHPTIKALAAHTVTIRCASVQRSGAPTGTQ